MSEPLLRADALSKEFRTARGRNAAAKPAAADVDLTLARGESLGIVGESGSGKTTVARMVAGFIRPSSGSIQFDGLDVSALRGRERARQRRRIQMIFQDPYSSLNPRKTIEQIVAAPLRTMGLKDRAEISSEVGRLLAEVGLAPASRFAHRYPRSLSGGQRQRVGIARAIAVQPEMIVADEPVSALDVSVRAQILNLFNDLRSRRELSMIFISHDLATVRSVCDRVMVMQQGRVVETGPTDSVLDQPRHEYTKSLVDSLLPVPWPGR